MSEIISDIIRKGEFVHSPHVSLCDMQLCHLILSKIFSKKKFCVMSQSRQTLQKEISYMVELSKHSTAKRIEEQKKFVLNHALKSLRREFQQKLHRAQSSLEMKKRFQVYYGLREMDLKYNSVSNSNIQKIFGNLKLREDLRRVFSSMSTETSYIIDPYFEKLEEKVGKLISRLREEIVNLQFNDEKKATAEKNINSLIKKSIPWTRHDILSAIRTFKMVYCRELSAE